MRRSIGGVLDVAAYRRLHFHTLPAQEQAAAIRRMAAAGHGDHTISAETGLPLGFIRQVLASRPEDPPPRAA